MSALEAFAAAGLPPEDPRLELRVVLELVRSRLTEAGNAPRLLSRVEGLLSPAGPVAVSREMLAQVARTLAGLCEELVQRASEWSSLTAIIVGQALAQEELLRELAQ
ncbi:MAG TPA: hypothetical protein VFO85_09830 [Vicinamibacteria bacterium]|nr:hypothetical protein [Vicinamibacteria bacterium]